MLPGCRFISGTSSKPLLKTLALSAVIFLTVSGGPYGLEPLMHYAGKNGSLLLLCLVPLLWDVPTILAVLELNSMMPAEGGYYKWVRRGMGERWAFYEGWWSWLYSFADMAIYPALAVTYISYFFPYLTEFRVPVCLTVVWVCALLNITGILNVGRISLTIGVIILIPFFILFYMAFTSGALNIAIPSPNLNGIGYSSLGMGIYTVMWNFIGWDNVTTYAGEVNRPVRSYLVSICISFALAFAVYFVTVLITINSGIDFLKLNDFGFPLLSEKIGGPFLGALTATGGLAMAYGVFSAVMLSISRVPAAMATDNLMPHFLCKLHPRFNTPYLAIIICAAAVSCLVVFSLPELIVIDVLLYGAGLFLEFIALLALRIKEPDAPRPFKIPLNTMMLTVMVSAPAIVFMFALYGIIANSGGHYAMFLVAFAALLSAEAVWLAIKRIRTSSR